MHRWILLDSSHKVLYDFEFPLQISFVVAKRKFICTENIVLSMVDWCQQHSLCCVCVCAHVYRTMVCVCVCVLPLKYLTAGGHSLTLLNRAVWKHMKTKLRDLTLHRTKLSTPNSPSHTKHWCSLLFRTQRKYGRMTHTLSVWASKKPFKMTHVHIWRYFHCWGRENIFECVRVSSWTLLHHVSLLDDLIG